MNPHAATLLIFSIVLLLSIAAHARAQVLLVSPRIDQNDRLESILEAATPSVDVERVRLFGRPKEPEGWRRSIGERAPLSLAGIRLVVLENAAASGLADISMAGGGNLLETLPGWFESGGHLFVVGGWPSFETYPGSPLAAILPAKIARDPGAKRFQTSKRRSLTGSASDGFQARHIHPVDAVQGEVLIAAAGEPFAIRGTVGRGEVVIMLGGVQEHYRPDAGDPEFGYFASRSWDRFVLDRVEKALGRRFEVGARTDVGALAATTIRVGHSFLPSDWFSDAAEGTLELIGPLGQKALTLRLPLAESRLPDTLRPGRYEAVFENAGQVRRRTVRIGTPVDLGGFDIRYFMLSHSPGPLGLAPGEAYARSAELASVGFTSAVYAAYVRRPLSNLRTLQEILHGGLQVVYYQSIRSNSRYPKRWPEGVDAPPIATDLSGKAIGWDIHSSAFRSEIGNLFDGQEAILALPGIRAVQVIEENKDGGRRSPSLRDRFAALGLTGTEQPGDPGWLTLEDLRSKATGVTYQAYRSLAHRAFPGLPLSSYWPGSYWYRPWAYTHRVSAFADAIDELLGPGYGYNGSKPPHGWLSVIRTTNEIFNAHDFDLSGSKGMVVYAQGKPISPTGGSRLGIATWRETAWTALAHGATGLGYFGLPEGDAIRPLESLHAEVHRIGPWLAGSPRRPGPMAVLASWSTRTGGSREETARHHGCITQLHDTLVYAIEDVNFVREEQLSSLPESIRSIAVTAAPLLPETTVDGLRAFVKRGGHLFVDGDAGSRGSAGPRKTDPWQAVRSTGRVHEIAVAERCNLLGRFQISRKLLGTRWRDRLAAIGITPLSDTQEPWTEARLSGDGDLRYWVFLNHHPEQQKLEARARLAAWTWLWRDLRTNQRVRPIEDPSGMRADVLVEKLDAVVWAGSKRPTSRLEIEALAEGHRVVIDVVAFDKEGRPVPDTTPLHLRVRNPEGREMLAAPLRSRVTTTGRAQWKIPIPADEQGGKWTVEVSAPIAGLDAKSLVEIAPPEGMNAGAS